MERIKIVAIGGGTGLATLLRGLKNFPASISAVVTMTDNGASSGRLSRELGTLPPGDVRKCLAALSNDEELITKLFEFRFNKGRGISGHSLGNLLLLALSEITGDFESAVEASSKILSIKGEVIPSTLEHVSLVAQLNNGQHALGEVDIPIGGHRFGIKSVAIVPERAKANPKAKYFIANADVILLGPGSLYTSIVPNFLIKGIREAVEQSRAQKIYICNASTERGETEGYGVREHIETILSFSKKLKIDQVLVNNKIVRKEKESKLGAVENISTDEKRILNIPIIRTNLINEQAPLYHDHRLLGQAIWNMVTTPKEISVSKPTAVHRQHQ